MTGMVTNLHLDKGFGFIKGADGVEYFFHRTALQNGAFDELAQGCAVTFEVGRGPKGPRAEDVRV